MTSPAADEPPATTSIRQSGGMFPARARLWDRIPSGLKWAVVLAILGFFVSISSTTRDSSHCTFLDVGQIALGLMAAFAAFVGYRQEAAKTHDRLKLGMTPTLIVAGLVFLVAAYHVVAGLGWVGGPCN